MRIRGVWRFATIVIVSMALVASACGSDSSEATDQAEGGQRGLTTLTFRLDWLVVGQDAPFYVALENGYFEDEGLNVEILEGQGSGLAATLVGNGTDDFGFSDAGVVATSVEDGVPIKMVMGILQKNPSVILSLASADINSPTDLVGKDVGASSGEAPLQLLPAYLKANGADISDVNVVNIDPSAKVTSLLQKRVDAIVAYATAELPAVQANATEDVNIQHYSDYGIVALSNGIIASDELIQNQPEVVDAFIRAIQRGIEWTLNDPQAAVKILVNRFPQTVNEDDATITLDETLSSLHTDRSEGEPLGYMVPEDWQDTVELYTDLDLLTPNAQPDNFYTNEFIGK
jgi:NitT/TauT family transport system substrate-binding protein